MFCKQHISDSQFLIQAHNHCFFIWVFVPFIVDMLIDKCRDEAIIFLFIILLSSVLCFSSFDVMTSYAFVILVSASEGEWKKIQTEIYTFVLFHNNFGIAQLPFFFFLTNSVYLFFALFLFFVNFIQFFSIC